MKLEEERSVVRNDGLDYNDFWNEEFDSESGEQEVIEREEHSSDSAQELEQVSDDF